MQIDLEIVMFLILFKTEEKKYKGENVIDNTFKKNSNYLAQLYFC